MANLLLIRHGQSQWNLENRFTGWVDVALSEHGVEEARLAGKKLGDLGYRWSFAHTSRLVRAQKTLEIILEAIGQKPAIWVDSALNERHYGDIQGMNKDEAREKFGKEQVHLWRRSYDVPPPGGECLEDTAKRTLPYFREYILKEVCAGQNVLVSAHGNSLRSIVMELDQLSAEEIVKIEIETGVPYLYQIAEDGLVQNKQKL